MVTVIAYLSFCMCTYQATVSPPANVVALAWPDDSPASSRRKMPFVQSDAAAWKLGFLERCRKRLCPALASVHSRSGATAHRPTMRFHLKLKLLESSDLCKNSN
eukprot:scaffold168199_cov26-Prasinocladus_malaysianus.AAC.1